MTGPGPQLGSTPITGDMIRAQNETLNWRLAALGVHTSSRYDMTPRLAPDAWEKLTALAEFGKEWRHLQDASQDPDGN